MTCAKQETPQRLSAADLIVEELPDELMVYDPDRNKAFCLNQTAAFVWKHADGTKTVDEIAAVMTKELAKPVTAEMVQFALDVLAKDGLLEASETGPAIPAGVTRRELLQKFGVGAMALPAVSVLFVSPMKAHASSAAAGSDPVDPPSYPNPQGTDSSLPNQHHNGGFWQWLENLF
jgi:hypothetical protein